MAPVLPPTADPDALPKRRRPRARPAGAPARDPTLVRAAALAAAAALGALVGLGVRTGASLGRLGVVTLRLRGLPEFVSADRRALGAALVGGLHVAAVAGVWGALAAAVTRALGRRGAGRAVQGAAAAALALVAVATDSLLPTPLRLAAGALSPAERVLVAALVVACAAAAVGRRPSRDAEPA